MPIKVACQCGKTLTAKDEYAGRSVKCAACGVKSVVPSVPLKPDESDIVGLVVAGSFSDRPESRPERKPARILGLLAAYALGLVTGLALWAAWPKTDYVRLVEGNSPEYMLAALDIQKPLEPYHEKIDFYRYLLNQSQEYYKDSPREIAWDISGTVSNLNHDGYSCDAFGLLYAAVECAKKSKEREGFSWEKINIRSFCHIYEFFRRDMNLSHRDAVDRIDSHEKI